MCIDQCLNYSIVIKEIPPSIKPQPCPNRLIKKTTNEFQCFMKHSYFWINSDQPCKINSCCNLYIYRLFYSSINVYTHLGHYLFGLFSTHSVIGHLHQIFISNPCWMCKKYTQIHGKSLFIRKKCTRDFGNV